MTWQKKPAEFKAYLTQIVEDSEEQYKHRQKCAEAVLNAPSMIAEAARALWELIEEQDECDQPYNYDHLRRLLNG